MIHRDRLEGIKKTHFLFTRKIDVETIFDEIKDRPLLDLKHSP